jgi:hypothetical protein
MKSVLYRVALLLPMAFGACASPTSDDATGEEQDEIRDASGNEVVVATRETWLKTSTADSATLGASDKCKIDKGESVKLKAFEPDGQHMTGRLMSAHGCGGKFGGGTKVYLYREHFRGWTIPTASPEVTIVDRPSNYAASCQRREANRTAANVGVIVLHNTLGSWESFKESWQSCDRIGAAHFVVRRDGTILRTIPEKNIAFHAAGANSDSIGVEIETAPHDDRTKPPPQGMTPVQESKVIALTKMLQHKWGVSKSEITMHRIARHAKSTDCASNVWGWEEKGGNDNFRAWRDRVF